MPVLMRKTTVLAAKGIRCDRCGKVDEIGANDFAVDRALGYDSASDMTRIKAALCDDCLLGILILHAPGATFVDDKGRDAPLARLSGALQAKLAREREAAALAAAAKPKAGRRRRSA